MLLTRASALADTRSHQFSAVLHERHPADVTTTIIVEEDSGGLIIHCALLDAALPCWPVDA